MKNTTLLILCFLLGFSSFAQQKELTIEDAVIGRWRQFYPEDMMSVEWRNNEHFTYVKAWTELVQMGVKESEENR